MSRITFALTPHPPFRLELTAWALRRRAANEIDLWDGRKYTRIFLLDGDALKVSVSQAGGHKDPKLNVVAAGETSDSRAAKSKISLMLGKMFSLREDLRNFYSLSGRERRLKPLAERFAGVKPPRFPTVFEALANAVSCQQVSLDLGIVLLNRLSRSYGVAFREGNVIFHAFPRPEDLAGLSPEVFRELGFSRNKGRALIELSERVLSGELEIENLEKMADTDVVQYLSRIRGVGRWTAEYVLLRGLGRLNVFPGDDVGAQRNLQHFMGLEERPDYERIKKITSRWQPYAGFVYFHFLLDSLKTRGYLP
jgi:DNA-3-methyladenine glycosylase II